MFELVLTIVKWVQVLACSVVSREIPLCPKPLTAKAPVVWFTASQFSEPERNGRLYPALVENLGIFIQNSIVNVFVADMTEPVLMISESFAPSKLRADLAPE